MLGEADGLGAAPAESAVHPSAEGRVVLSNFKLSAWLAGLLAMLCSTTSCAADTALPADAAQRLDAAIQREHAAGRFDGVVLVGRGDSVVYQRAIGLADRAGQRPHRVDAVWRWASVSKQVAALVVMQQVEQGRLSLDARLDTLLPDFKAPRAADISVRMLLQHTSGLPNPDAGPGFYETRFKDEAGPVQAALAYCAGAPGAAPAGPPGERFSYNNCDTLVLQAVLEKLAGRPYARVLADLVSRPLQSPTLSLVPATSAVPPGPVGYLDTGKPEPSFSLASFGAGGALVGTPQDLWQLDRALMQRQLLGEAATRTMWQGDPRLGYVALGAWSFRAALAGCGQPLALVERRGQIGGVQVRNLMAPELGAALIVFSNTAATEFGEIWQGRGLTHELASAGFSAFCQAAPADGEASGGHAPKLAPAVAPG